MKKKERVNSVFNALVRFNGGVAGESVEEAKATFQREMEAGVLGRIKTKETEKLIEKGKFTAEIVETGKSLGLIVDSFRGSGGAKRTSSGGARGGSVRNAFSEAHPEIYKGTRTIDNDAKVLFRQWVEAYGLGNVFVEVKAILNEYDQPIGIYFPSKESKRGLAAKKAETNESNAQSVEVTA